MKKDAKPIAGLRTRATADAEAASSALSSYKRFSSIFSAEAARQAAGAKAYPTEKATADAATKALVKALSGVCIECSPSLLVPTLVGSSPREAKYLPARNLSSSPDPLPALLLLLEIPFIFEAKPSFRASLTGPLQSLGIATRKPTWCIRSRCAGLA